MIERGIRGGMSVITHRLAHANNKCLPQQYDAGLPESYCIYLDANNLYGWAMSLHMPERNLHFLKRSEINRLDIMKVSDDAEEGYILEVDLIYPESLHDLHNDLPLAPERRHVNSAEWSAKQKQLSLSCSFVARSTSCTTTATSTTTKTTQLSDDDDHYDDNRSSSSNSNNNNNDNEDGGKKEDIFGASKKQSNSSKLIADFHTKNNYVVHYRNLKLYLRLGMKITCIHRVVAFRQSQWLKSYIELNTELRKKAKNAFQRDFYKLMNNSVFGKTMENVRNYRNFNLVNDSRTLARIVQKPTFERCHIINKDLVLTFSLKKKVKLFKPIFVGFTILDNAKQLMYEFHYDVIKARYGERAQLCFTDTDSLLYLIQTRDIYADMKDQSHLYDFSDYPKEHDLYSTANKKVLGKMKDELSGKPICEFVGLRSKMYSIQVGCPTSGKDGGGGGGEQRKTAKGVKRETIRKCLTHEMFKECLLSGKSFVERMRNIRSYNHNIFSTLQEKVALSAFDDKRYILDDGIHTRAYGHYRNNAPQQQQRRRPLGQKQQRKTNTTTTTTKTTTTTTTTN